jgi:bacillithiol synthase
VSEPRVVTDPIDGPALTRAMRDGALSPALAPPRPRTVDEWRARSALVQQSVARDWLESLRGAFAATGAPRARLERVAAAGGIVITTGQQPGLFGGPVYTWSKAVSALALADAIERATGIAAAPVFFAATDDADFEEASVTHVIVRGALQTLAMPQAPAAGTPMARASVGDATPLLATLREACASMPYDAAFRACEASYSAGATVGGAYVALTRALLEPLGVAVLDASHADVRRAGERVARVALERAEGVAHALESRRATLAGAGFDTQVADVAALSLVFVQQEGIKRRVPIREAGDIVRRATPESLSPNVLLRPVLERAILPTIAYVAGPAEMAYFAQVSAVADALDLPQPLAVPRWSCTIVEPSVDRALARLGIGLDELHDVTALERRLAAASLPDGLHDSISALRAAVHAALADIQRRDGGALLAQPSLDGAGRSIGFRIDRLERRLLAAAKRRDSDALRDLRMVRTAIRPMGQRQERTLNFIPFLATWGDALWRAMTAEAQAHARALIEEAPAPALSRGR